MNRRRFLAGCGTLGVAGLAGCVGDGSDGGDADDHDGSVRPDGEPDTVPEPLHCDDEDGERHYVESSVETVSYGEAAGFSVRSNGTSFEYGDTVEITLRNTTDETAETGNRNKYNLECYTEEGWQEVRIWTAEFPAPIPDEAIPHDPGDGFDWEIELTEEGIATGTIHDEDIAVCPPLQSGRYRFTFFGLIGEGGIAVEFDLHRDD